MDLGKSEGSRKTFVTKGLRETSRYYGFPAQALSGRCRSSDLSERKIGPPDIAPLMWNQQISGCLANVIFILVSATFGVETDLKIFAHIKK